MLIGVANKLGMKYVETRMIEGEILKSCLIKQSQYIQRLKNNWLSIHPTGLHVSKGENHNHGKHG